jgi:hypothetical protein
VKSHYASRSLHFALMYIMEQSETCQAVDMCHLFRVPKDLDNSVLWPEDKNSPNVAHACRKRRLKWAPSAWGIAGSWSSRLGLGVGFTAPPRKNPVVTKSKEEQEVLGRNNMPSFPT